MNEIDFFLDRASRKRPKKLEPLETAPIVLHGATTGRGSAWRHTKTGYRSDLGIVLRSGWEANCARIFTSYGIKFEFESELFKFPIVRGTKSYLPDFYLPKTKEYVEVKGYFDDKSRIKIKRFRKYYPDKQLLLIIGDSKNSRSIADSLEVPYLLYPKIAHHFGPLISNWEGSK